MEHERAARGGDRQRVEVVQCGECGQEAGQGQRWRVGQRRRRVAEAKVRVAQRRQIQPRQRAGWVWAEGEKVSPGSLRGGQVAHRRRAVE